jgi:hypothetical protein
MFQPSLDECIAHFEAQSAKYEKEMMEFRRQFPLSMDFQFNLYGALLTLANEVADLKALARWDELEESEDD